MSNEKDQLEVLLIDYIDGRLSESERRRVETLLSSDETARTLHAQLEEVIRTMENSPVPQPTPRLRERFSQLLREESGEAKSRSIFFAPAFYRVAAAVALLIIGGGTGYWISRQRQQQDELAAMKRQVEETRSLVIGLIRNSESASQRLNGVKASLTATTTTAPDDEIVEALVRAMNEDKNTNVRLAALEALSRFRDEGPVRNALVESLSMQSDPLVQMALIQLMVEMKENGSLPRLRQLTEDENSLEAVRDEASAALIKLSEV